MSELTFDVGWMRSLFAWIAETFLHDSAVGMALRVSRRKSVQEFWELNVERDRYCEMYYRDVCRSYMPP